jgi:tetratricopeptide (TPR) repeat protein
MIAEQPLTDGTIALLNLDAQIDALDAEVSDGGTAIQTRAVLVELIALRGLIIGRIADYERAAAIAEQLVSDAPTDAQAWVARARTRSGFHRFSDALADLDRAAQLSVDADTVNAERAAIFQAVGRYDDAWTLRAKAEARRTSFEHVAALVGLHAERGELELAERVYAESRSRYRGVSPFPLALLEFQLGLMWMNDGRLDRARRFFERAHRLVPGYAPAEGHLAEVEAELGDVDSALARLFWLAGLSDDPDYAAQLARILGESGRDLESDGWRRLAAARYDDLIARHPEAFADHAAEFWLAAGRDPSKAVRLAQKNLEVRNTPRARALLAQAVAATATSSPSPAVGGRHPGHSTPVISSSG